MKQKLILVFLFVLASVLWSQESFFDWDMDSIFEEEPVTDETNEITDQYETSPILSLIRRSGFNIHSGYDISVFIAPGWNEYPWAAANEDNLYYLERGILLSNTITLDAQISEIFRVVSNFTISVPPMYFFALGNFYFDYNLYNRAFIRAGKYDMAWGVSPNFGFTNLLARVPANAEYIGDSYIFKVDYPINKGGLQVLTLTRGNPMVLEKEDFGFGAKYNLALAFADFDFGLYYLKDMPFRSFLSVRKTIRKFDLYTESLIAINYNENYDFSGALNFGFSRSFFNDKFNINSEFFFNGEKDSYWYQSKTDYKEAEVTAIIEEFTIAFNVSYKIFEKINLRAFLGVLYAPSQNSAHITPGLVMNPLNHMEIGLALPTAVGSETGYYRTHTPRWAPCSVPLPFAVYFYIKLTGGVSL